MATLQRACRGDAKSLPNAHIISARALYPSLAAGVASVARRAPCKPATAWWLVADANRETDVDRMAYHGALTRRKRKSIRQYRSAVVASTKSMHVVALVKND